MIHISFPGNLRQPNRKNPVLGLDIRPMRQPFLFVNPFPFVWYISPVPKAFFPRCWINNSRREKYVIIKGPAETSPFIVNWFKRVPIVKNVVTLLLVDLPGAVEAAALEGAEQVGEGLGGDVDGVADAADAAVADGGLGGGAVGGGDGDGLVAEGVRGLVEAVRRGRADVVPEVLGDGHDVLRVVLARVLVAARAQRRVVVRDLARELLAVRDPVAACAAARRAGAGRRRGRGGVCGSCGRDGFCRGSWRSRRRLGRGGGQSCRGRRGRVGSSLGEADSSGWRGLVGLRHSLGGSDLGGLYYGSLYYGSLYHRSLYHGGGNAARAGGIRLEKLSRGAGAGLLGRRTDSLCGVVVNYDGGRLPDSFPFGDEVALLMVVTLVAVGLSHGE